MYCIEMMSIASVAKHCSILCVVVRYSMRLSTSLYPSSRPPCPGCQACRSSSPLATPAAAPGLRAAPPAGAGTVPRSNKVQHKTAVPATGQGAVGGKGRLRAVEAAEGESMWYALGPRGERMWCSAGPRGVSLWYALGPRGCPCGVPLAPEGRQWRRCRLQPLLLCALPSGHPAPAGEHYLPTVQYSSVQYSTLQYAVQYSTVLYDVWLRDCD